MRKRKAFLVASLVLLLLGVGAWGCNQPTDTPTSCPTCERCPPCDVRALELERCKAARTLEAESASATITALETALAIYEGTPPPPDHIRCEDAINHIGEFKTVQGFFYCSYRPDIGGQPTFCNCPVDDPNHDFAALIWGDERPIFESCLGGPPEDLLDMHTLYVEGLVEIYHSDRLNRDIPQIILTECGQLTVIQ